MSRTLLTILLLLSLVFNAFFLLGRFSTESVAVADPGERLAQSLKLTDRQRIRFDELRSNLQADTAAPRAHIAELQGNLAAVLEEVSPDLERARSLVEQISTERLAAQSMAADHLGSFLDILDPDQRRRLGRRMGAMSHPDRGPADLSAFDADGDGRLDETERAEATKLIRERHNTMREQRKALAAQFDADGDGSLNPDERRAFREHLLEQGLAPQRPRGHRVGDHDGPPEGRRGDGRRGPHNGHPPGSGPPPGHGPPDGPPPPA